jgi:hypothetical protein
MKHEITTALAALTVVALALATASPATAQKPLPTPESYDVEIAPVGDSGVTGIAHLVLRGDRLVVLIRAYGLDPTHEHPVIIHGFPGGRSSVCPDAAAAVQEESDRFASDDARALFGNGLVGLQPSPQADLSGVVEFQHGYDVDAASVGPLTRRTLVMYTEDGMAIGCGEIRGEPSV